MSYFFHTGRRAGALLPQTAKLLLAGLLLTTACKQEPGSPPLPDFGPSSVNFTQPGLYPEGLEYDHASRSFLVSSLTRGAIGRVSETGTYSVLSNDTALVSTVGLQLDEARGRLLAAVSDPGYNKERTRPGNQGKLAAVAVLNSRTGRLTDYINLGRLRPGQPHFANDIAVDAAGNLYVTDSFSPIIYKVDRRGQASVFLENPQFAAPAGSFGLNGIVYHPDGYLLVVKSDNGALFKIPLDKPSSFSRVAVAQNLKAADGIELQNNLTLLVVANAQSAVYRLNSLTGWASATTTGKYTTPPVFPTSLARRNDFGDYVLYAHLGALQTGQEPPVATFTIDKVVFNLP